MQASVATILGSLVPVFALIALGHVLYRAQMPGHAFWTQLERLVYYILFLALLVGTLRTAPVHATRNLPVAAPLLSGRTGRTLVVLAMQPRRPVHRPRRTTILHGAGRVNSHSVVATSHAQRGKQSVATAALTPRGQNSVIHLLSTSVVNR